MSEDLQANTDIDRTLQEIHNLSYFYHWGREECWNTPCTERGVFNDMIIKQLKAESGNGSMNSGKSKKGKEYKESR